jgi:filamentous hemagglutinin
MFRVAVDTSRTWQVAGQLALTPAFGLASAGEGIGLLAPEIGEGGGGLALRFSQTTASASFSGEGTFAGRTIGGLAADLRAGVIAPSQVPVRYVLNGGNNLIVNTRSSLALMRAGIPQSQWNLINTTATDLAPIQARLLSNGLGGGHVHPPNYRRWQICK